MITIRPMFSKMSVEKGWKLVVSKIMSSEKVQLITITSCAILQAKLLVVKHFQSLIPFPFPQKSC